MAIHPATVRRRIGNDVFIIMDNEGHEYQINVNNRHFPEESTRLLGHVCMKVAGIGVGTPLDIELSEGCVFDIRFGVGDVDPPKEPEESIVSHTMGDDGNAAFAARACSCQIFCHRRNIVPTSPIGIFEPNQRIVHMTERFRGKIVATQILILD